MFRRRDTTITNAISKMNTMKIEDIEFPEYPVFAVGGAEGRPSYYAPLLKPTDVIPRLHPHFGITGTLDAAVNLIQSGLDSIGDLNTTFCASESLWNLTFMNGFIHMEGTVRLYRTSTRVDGYTHIVEFHKTSGDAWKSRDISEIIKTLFYPIEESFEPVPLVTITEEQRKALLDFDKKYGEKYIVEPRQEYRIPTTDEIKQTYIGLLKHGRYSAVIDTFPVVASFYGDKEMPPLTELDKECIEVLMTFIVAPPFQSKWPELYSIYTLANMSRSKEYCIEINRAYEVLSKGSQIGLEELIESILIAEEAPAEQTRVKIWELLQNIDLYKGGSV